MIRYSVCRCPRLAGSLFSFTLYSFWLLHDTVGCDLVQYRYKTYRDCDVAVAGGGVQQLVPIGSVRSGVRCGAVRYVLG